MYTKLFLLAAISIIISSSIVIDKTNLRILSHSEKTTEEHSITSSSEKTKNTLPFGIDLSDVPHTDNSTHGHSHSGDDDGKNHHFHFNHFTHRRRERITSVLGKIIVLATFISSLISGFYLWHY